MRGPWSDRYGNWECVGADSPVRELHGECPSNKCFSILRTMLPVSCLVRIICSRMKNEFSEEIPLPEPLEPWIYYLPSVLMELGFKLYV